MDTTEKLPPATNSSDSPKVEVEGSFAKMLARFRATGASIKKATNKITNPYVSPEAARLRRKIKDAAKKKARTAKAARKRNRR